MRLDGEEVTTPAMPAAIDAIIDSLAELTERHRDAVTSERISRTIGAATAGKW